MRDDLLGCPKLIVSFHLFVSHCAQASTIASLSYVSRLKILNLSRLKTNRNRSDALTFSSFSTSLGTFRQTQLVTIAFKLFS